MYAGFSDSGREFTTEDILVAMSNTVPLSRSQQERIKVLRTWLTDGRARGASDGSTDSRGVIPLGALRPCDVTVADGGDNVL